MGEIMREIKFRGKSIENREWIYGSPLLLGDERYIYPHDHGDLDDTDFGYAFDEVIPETVGQYIGLIDKNGKEVYEGDIIVWHNVSGYPDGFGTVIWDDVHAAWFLLREEQGIDDTIYDFYNLRIIGNIHANPELISEGL
jgi:uncharacterized phage protein (TIGR01671 family)